MRASCSTTTRVEHATKDSVIDFLSVYTFLQAGGFQRRAENGRMAEAFQVRTAWYGPGDVSPVGHCANVTLGRCLLPTSGIQEWTFPNDRLQEVFDGYPVVKDGYVYANEKPDGASR